MIVDRAPAAPRRILLAPPGSRISFTVFALDLLPVRASFDAFAGTVLENTAPGGACTIDVTVQMASLRMDDPERRRQALAPDMLDVGRFPSMRFVGACQPQAIAGRLTLHGITRPFTMAMHREGAQIVCVGALSRDDYGIHGMATTIAPRIRIRLSVHLPN